MNELIRICGVALTLLLCLTLLRDKVPAIGLSLALCGVAVIVLLFLPMAERVIRCVRGLMTATGLDGTLWTPVAQIVGVCLVVKIAAELCRDAGERTLAATVEICGAAAGILCAIPLVEQALRLIRAI